MSCQCASSLPFVFGYFTETATPEKLHSSLWKIRHFCSPLLFLSKWMQQEVNLPHHFMTGYDLIWLALPCSMFFMNKYFWKKWIVYSKLHFIKYEQLILTRIAVLFVIDVQDPAIFLRRLPHLGFLLIYVPACWFHQNLALYSLLLA